MNGVVKIKICGMRDVDNIRQVADLEPDMLGLIFVESSPRFVAEEHTNLELSSTLKNLDKRIKKVGVFVNAELEEITAKVRRYRLDFVQLHGGESFEFCAELRAWVPGVGIIKAFGVDEEFNLSVTEPYQLYCNYFLFDTRCQAHGGSGRSFSWKLLDSYCGETPFLLSGGIGPENIGAALEWLSTAQNGAGLDLNSAVESEPGLKSVELVREVLGRVRGERSR